MMRLFELHCHGCVRLIGTTDVTHDLGLGRAHDLALARDLGFDFRKSSE